MQSRLLNKTLIVVASVLTLWGCVASYRNNLLLEAAHKGDTEKVKELIRKGANPDATDAEGFNAYLAASTNGHMETMQYLKSVRAKEDPGF